MNRDHTAWSPVKLKRRDRVVWAIASLVLDLASEEYRLWLRGLFIYGLRSAVRDQVEGLPPPPAVPVPPGTPPPP